MICLGVILNEVPQNIIFARVILINWGRSCKYSGISFRFSEELLSAKSDEL